MQKAPGLCTQKTSARVDEGRNYSITGGHSKKGPSIVGKNREICRFLCVPQVLFSMASRNTVVLNMLLAKKMRTLTVEKRGGENSLLCDPESTSYGCYCNTITGDHS